MKKMLLILIFLAAFALEGWSARTINSATLNGLSNVTVLASNTISAAVNVSITTGNNADRWRSTAWRIGSSGGYTCADTTNYSGSGTYSNTFNITAPSAIGTYDVSFITYNDNGCSTNPSAAFTVANAVTVTGTNADLSITNTVDNPSPSVGDTVTYTLVGTNNGPSPSQFKITDVLRSGLTYVSATRTPTTNFSCSQTAGTVTCSGTNSFTSGQSATVTITATVTGAVGTPINNTAQITSNNSVSDFNTANNSASVSITPTTATTYTANSRAFALRNAINARGDIKLIGNTILCKNNGSGVCTDPGTQANNAFSAIYADLDGDPSTFSSTSADLALPSGSKVLWAGLYWAGIFPNSFSADKTAARTVKLKIPGGTYTTVTASQLDYSGTNYQGFADVTSILNLANPNGTYYTANLTTALGTSAYGAWALSITYQDDTDTLKNLTIWDGFNAMGGNNLSTTISGFRTPLSGTVASTFFIFVAEGDIAYTGENIQIANKAGTLKNIFNTLNPLNNQFNSNITYKNTANLARNPNYANTAGIDIDTYDITGFLDLNQTSTTIKLTGGTDRYNVGAFGFATQIYSPTIGNFEKNSSISYDSNQTCGSDKDLRGSTINYTLSFKNTGTEAASNVRIYDDFQANGILPYLDMNQTTKPIATLLSGTASSTVTCDKNSTAVYCDFSNVAINTQYKITFSTKVQTLIQLTNDVNLTNTAYAHYYNASTGDEITQLSSSNNQIAGGICQILPVAEYRFDECIWKGISGEVSDSSGNGYNGSINSSLTTYSGGQICRMSMFNGSSQYITVPSSAIAPLHSTGSLSFWIKTTQVGNATNWLAPGVTGVEQSGGQDDIFWGWIDNNGKIGVTAKSDTIHSKSTTSINDGTWHHVVLTRDASSGILQTFIDGSLEGNAAGGTGTVGTTFSSIGRIENTGGTPAYLSGSLDEVKIFDRVLNATEVLNIYSNENDSIGYNGQTRTCTACSFPASLEYRMDECSWNGIAGEVIDSSGSDLNATAKTANNNSYSELSTQIIDNGALFVRTAQQYLSIPTLTTDKINFYNGFSITTWAKFSSAGSWERIFDFGNGTASSNIFLGRYGTTNNLVLGINNAGTDSYTIGTNAITDTNWHFWGVVCEGNGVCRLYKDGVKIVQSTVMLIPSDTNRTLNYIGHSNWSADEYLQGGVDEFKVFNSNLSDTQIDFIYSNESSGKNYDGSARSGNSCSPSFIYDYQLDECNRTSLTVIDYGYAGNNATAKHNSDNTDGLYPQTCNDTGAIVCANAQFKGYGYSVSYSPWYYTSKYYIEAPDTNSFSPLQNNGEMTLYGWFKTSATGTQTIVTKAGSLTTNKEYRMWIDAGVLKFTLWDKWGAATTHTIKSGVNDGSWHHAAVSIKTGSGAVTLKGYLDGVLQSTSTASSYAGYPSDTSGSLYMGAMNWGSLEDFFTGNLDELHMSDSADSAQAIYTIYSNELLHYNADGSARTCSCGCSVIVAEPAVMFDAWDTFRSISDRNISTKIVNKPFLLTIASINEAHTGLQDFNGTVCAQILNTATSTQLSRQCHAWTNTQTDSTFSSTINKAVPDAKVKLSWKKNDFTGTFSEGSEDNSTTASDHFSIRPASFGISAANAVAGVNFDINLTAPIYGSSTASSEYNEISGNTFDFSIAEHNASCLTGTFNPTLTAFSFVNGAKTFTTRYSEVGILDINISDTNKTCATRFTAIDCDDANVSDGTNFTADLLPIGLTQKSITVTPDHFDVNATLTNFSGGTFTYLSTDLNMSGQLDLNITAKNGEGNTTTNYTSGCYAKDTTVTLPHSTVPAPLTKIFYHDSLTLSDSNITKASSIASTYAASKFTQGIVTPRITFNFDRNSSTPLNPFNFNITSADVNDSDHVLGSGTPLGNTKFVYGRVRTYNVTTNVSPAPNPIEFEVYSTTSGGYVSGMPQNVLGWYRNLNHDEAAQGNVIQGGFAAGTTDPAVNTSSVPSNGVQVVTTTSIHNQTVHLDISPWLWYSSTNSYNYATNCTQHPCFNYTYTDTTGGVQGVSSGTFQGSDFNMAPAKNITNKGVKIFR